MTRFIFILISSLLVFTSYGQCLEITSILVDACDDISGVEGENEMVTFTNGVLPLDTGDIEVDWPNNPFRGWCADPSKTAELNATITNGCGELVEPPNGIIPANANVIVITSTDVNAIDNTFEGLSETLYIIYQCSGNTAGHFANSGSGTRDLIFTITGGCNQVEMVTYDRGPLPSIDGARVYFDAVGNATYDGTQGCTAPVTSISSSWDIGEVCVSNSIIDLNTLLSPSATPGGAWSGDGVTGNNFDPSALGGMNATVTYTITNSACVTGSDSTIIFPVLLEPTQGTDTYQNCDSVFYNGTWYTANTNFIENYPATTTFGCDSSAQIFIEISDAIRDTVYISGCDSIMFEGQWVYQDTLINDTVTGTTAMLGDTILQTSFEDSDGWMDHSSGDWTQVDSYGTWTAVDMYANQFNPNTGNRNIGMNTVGDYIEFPPVSNPQTLTYYDRLSSAATNTNELAMQYFDGGTWQTISTDICTHVDYELVTVDLSSISALVNVRIRIFRTQDDRSAYIDDVVIEGSAGTAAACDSINTTIITILNSVNSFENQTTTNPADVGTVVTPFPGGAANGCDSTHTVVTTFVSSCDLDTTTVMSYNVLQYTSNPIVNRDADFITILSAAEPDILVLQEIQQEVGANRFRDNVMANVSADYAMATFINSNDMDNVLFYKQTEFNFVSTTTHANSGPRDFHEFQLTHKGSCTPFYIYSLHLKAGTAPADEATRNTQANELRAITNALPAGTNFMVVGDFNSYSDTEPAYVTFTNDTGNEGHVNDVLSLAGTWNNPLYAPHHTQSPRTTNFGGGAPGGLDDRLDMILYSEAIENGADNMNHVPDLYQAYGNDGQHYNVALTDAPANGVVSAVVSQALHDASDHLPVMTGFTFCITIDTTFVTDTLCFGETYPLPSGAVASATGIYNDISTTASGCDTIVELDLTILSEKAHIINDTLCFGESITVNGTVYNSSVTGATETINNVGAFMCDSTITINLRVLPATVTQALPNDTICFGQSTMIFNQNQNTADTYFDTIPNQLDCDSIIRSITLVVLPNETAIDTQSACGSYTWIDGITYTTSNNTAIAVVNGVNDDCDTTYTLDLTILPNETDTETYVECNSFTWRNGVTYTSSNNTDIFTIPGVATNGCDSVLTLDLTILFPATSVDIQSSCTPFTWIDGVTYTTSNNTAIEVLTGAAANGCDSTVTLNLIISSPLIINDTLSACDSYTWIDGVTYTTSNNTATHLVTGMNGDCDTTYTLDLTIEQTPIANISNDTTINLGEQVILTVEDNATTYTWSNGDFGATSVVSPTETTIYTVTVANGACDDEASVQVIVINEEIEVLLPTAFSPNGDGTNDLFRIVNSEDFTSITMRIYNRWGELIYDGSDGNHAWDGVYKGRMQNVGVYTYFVDVSTTRGENLQLTGNITLLK